MAALLACLPATGAAARGRDWNVVLIVVDTLRPDHMGTYGYHKNTTPRIDAWARSAAVFSTAVAPANWTLPSLASIMTSLHPPAHGATEYQTESGLWPVMKQPYRLDGSRLTLAEILSRHGYVCGGVVSGSVARPEFGFDQGFATYDYSRAPGREPRPIAELLPAALAFLEANRGKKFFLYLHPADPHNPYRSTRHYEKKWDKDYAGRINSDWETMMQITDGKIPFTARDIEHLKALYDGSISYVDHHLGRLFKKLGRLGLSEKTVVIFTSDHGEGFLEHGQLDHGNAPYDELLKVPLIMRVPGRPEGARIANLVSSVDILPTVLDALEIPPPGHVQGASLLPLMDGRPMMERAAFARVSVHRRKSESAEIVRAGGWKYIRFSKDDPDELYDLNQDPMEQNNLARQRPDLSRKFLKDLDDWRTENKGLLEKLPFSPDSDAWMDRSVAEGLKKMGYLRAR